MLSTYKREQKERSVPPFISAGGTHLRTEIFLDTLSSQEIRLLEENIRRDVEQVFPETEYLLHSPSLLFAHLSRDNLSSMLRITAASLGIISLVLLFLSGSLHMGLLSIIPNILPPLAAFGIWGIVYGQAGLGVSLGVALAIGIIVDDTVHILFAHMRSRKKGLSKNDATEHTLRHVSDAVILTSGILVVGFLFLATSGFEPTAHMGKMTVLIMFCALGIDLFLYTALLSGTQK
ncbi:MMPL family transporter [Chitinivibrio alkaliphilus]